MIQTAAEHDCPVSAVCQSTREHRLPHFGIVAGMRLPRHDRLYEIARVIEKPTPTLAEQELITPGLRSGHYLGYFGMHVLNSTAMTCLREVTADASRSAPATLSDATSLLPSRGRYLAHQLSGSRYNIGEKYGLLIAQLALTLAGEDSRPPND